MKYSIKYQREIALGCVFHFEFYKKFYLPLFLSDYFKNVLNKIIDNYHKYNKVLWDSIYRSEVLSMNYMERSLLLLLYSELLDSDVSESLLVFIYIRLAKKYCRKNFHRLIPIFVSNAKKNS